MRLSLSITGFTLKMYGEKNKFSIFLMLMCYMISMYSLSIVEYLIQNSLSKLACWFINFLEWKNIRTHLKQMYFCINIMKATTYDIYPCTSSVMSSILSENKILTKSLWSHTLYTFCISDWNLIKDAIYMNF